MSHREEILRQHQDWLDDPTQPWLRDEDLLERWFEILATTVAIDFDGVIHPYTEGWVGSTPAPEPPMPGVKEFMRHLVEVDGFRLVVFSTRCDHEAGMAGTKAWLEEHGLMKYIDDVTCQKPAAIAYVDDRAVAFTGDFRTVQIGIYNLARGRSHGAGQQ